VLARQLHLAALMGTIPAEYFMYYYFSDEILGELKAKPTTRAEDILAEVPGYWEHYQEQLGRERPELDPKRSRGGIPSFTLSTPTRYVHTVNEMAAIRDAGGREVAASSSLRRGHAAGDRRRPCRATAASPPWWR